LRTDRPGEPARIDKESRTVSHGRWLQVMMIADALFMILVCRNGTVFRNPDRPDISLAFGGFVLIYSGSKVYYGLIRYY
jgi:hypothetical protein